MTPAEKVHMLEVERAMVRAGRHAGPSSESDTAQMCAARLAELGRASAGFETTKARRTKRRAFQRARKAAGL